MLLIDNKLVKISYLFQSDDILSYLTNLYMFIKNWLVDYGLVKIRETH